jgi:GTPase SAR1 family protein
LFENDCVIAFVGSKSDMENSRVVIKADVERYAKDSDYVFLECSSKTGENIHEVFDEAVSKAVKILNSRNSFTVS